MPKFQGRSAELFEDLVQALVEEGRETGQFEIDSMRFAQMELLGHGLGKELSRRVQQALADCQTQQMAQSFACPQGAGKGVRNRLLVFWVGLAA